MPETVQYIVLYLLAVNLVGFAAMGIDNNGTIVTCIIVVVGFIGLLVGFLNIEKLKFKEEAHSLSVKQVRQTVFSNLMIIICLLWYSYSIILGLIGANS